MAPPKKLPVVAQPVGTRVRWSVVLCGLFVMGLAIFLAIFYPKQTLRVAWMLKVLFSLGAACFASLIPGSITLKGKLHKKPIKATGAVVFFLLLYQVNIQPVGERVGRAVGLKSTKVSINDELAGGGVKLEPGTVLC
jgi:hypothetical protein